MRNWFKRVFQVTYICASPQITARSDAGGPAWNIQGNVFKAASISHAKSTAWRRHGLRLRDKQHVRASVRSPRLLGFERTLVEVYLSSPGKTCQSQRRQMSPTWASQARQTSNQGIATQKPEIGYLSSGKVYSLQRMNKDRECAGINTQRVTNFLN